jgi:hypothetical protein
MRPTTTLPIAWTALKILTLLNWLTGAAILALLTATFAAEDWTFRALGVTPASDLWPLMNGMRLIAVLGLAAVPVNHGILSRLLPIVETVRKRDPFIAANAYRLNTIAWLLLALQLLSVAIAIVAGLISTPEHPIQLDAGFSIPGWLCVFFTFILARVFAEGTLMREELDGTI